MVKANNNSSSKKLFRLNSKVKVTSKNIRSYRLIDKFKYKPTQEEFLIYLSYVLTFFLGMKSSIL